MRLIFKLLAFPFVLVTGLLYLVCKFLVIASGAVLGILSGIVFLASLVLFFTRCPALFFTIRGCLTRQLFLFGGIT